MVLFEIKGVIQSDSEESEASDWMKAQILHFVQNDRIQTIELSITAK
jgi:hypothetical protein